MCYLRKKANKMFVSHSLVHAAKANRRMPVHKPREACFPRWIKSSLSLSALINLTAFLFTGTFSFGRFPLFTWWRLVICQKSLHLHNRFNCEAIVRGDVQGMTTLVGRRLGKTLTIKLRVWDLAMFTNYTQDKRDARR